MSGYVFPDQDILAGEGRIGNCFQAALAGVLGTRLTAVPHFPLLGQIHWLQCALAWLEVEHGMVASIQKDDYDEEGLKPMRLCIARGFSPRGIFHACVADSETGDILHDPHPSHTGLVAIDSYLYLFPKNRGKT